MVGRNHYRNRGRSNKKGKKRARRSSALNKENAAAAKGRTDLTLKESAAGGWETGSESKNVGGDAGGPPTAVVKPMGCRRIAALAASSRGSLDTTSTDYSSDDVTLSSSECSFSSSSGRRTSGRYSSSSTASSSTASSSTSGIRSLSARSASTGSYSIGSSSTCATPECGGAGRAKPQPLRQQNSVTSSEDSFISRTKRKKRRNRKTKKVEVEEKVECDCRSPEECKQDSQPAGAASTRAPAPPRCHRTHEAQDVKIFSRREAEGGSTHTQKQGPALVPAPPTEPHDKNEGLAGKTSSGDLIIGGYEENNNRSEHCKEKKDCKKQRDKKRSPRKQKKKSKKVEACETIEIASQFEEGTLSAPKTNASLATTKKEVSVNVISIEVEGELHYESEESTLSSDVQQELVNKGVDGLTHTLKNTVQMLTDRVFETQMSDGGSVTEPTDGGRDHARSDRALFGAETLVYTVHTPAGGHVDARLGDSLQQPGHSAGGAVNVQSEKVSSDPSESVSDNKGNEGHNDIDSDETSLSNPSEMNVDRGAIDHPLDRDSGQVEISGALFASGVDIPEAAIVEDDIGSDETEAISNETEEANSLEAVSDQAEAISKLEITADFTEDLVSRGGVGGNTDFVIESKEVEADTIETDIISHNGHVDEDEITAGKPDAVLCNENEKQSEININTGSASSLADHLEVVADSTEVACQVIANQDAASTSDGQAAESRAGNPPSFHTQAAEPAAATTSEAEVAIIRSEDSAAADAAEVESLLPQAAASDGDQFMEGRGWDGRLMKEEAKDGGERTTERHERNERGEESQDKERDSDGGVGEKHLVEEGKRENVEAQKEPREETNVPKESEEIKKRKRTEIEDYERDEEESDSASDSGVGGRGKGGACILEAGLSARDSARERGGVDKELLTTNMDVISPTEQFEIVDYITGRDETEPDIVVFDVKDRNDELALTGAVRETSDTEEIGAVGENDICDDDGDGDVIVAVKNEPSREDVAIFINDNILSLNPSGTRSIVDVLRSSDEHGEDLVIVDIEDGRGEADEGASTEGSEEEELLLGREGQEGGNDRKCAEYRVKEQEKEQVKGMGEERKYNVEEGKTQVSCKQETKNENILLNDEVEEVKEEQKIREANFTDNVPGELQVPNVAPTVDAALAELDSIPDGVCEAGDVEEEEEDEEEWSYFRMEPQTQPQGEDILVPGGPTAPVAPPSEAPQSVDTVIDGEGIVAAAPKSPSHEDLLTSPMEAAPQDQVIGEVYSEKIPSPHEADQPPVMENPPDILQAGVDEGTFGFESSARTLDLMQTSMDKVPDLMEGNFEQPSSPHGSVSPRVPGSPRSVEGFVTSVELNTPEENFGTNFAINQNQDSLTSAMEQPSGPFSVYVSSSPEPSSLEPSLQAPVDLVNFSGVANGQVEEESSQVALDSPVEIVHAQSTVEVVAPPSPVDIAGPETQFIIPEHETGQANTDVQQPSDITFVPEKAVEPVAEVPVSVFVDESTPVSEPDTADLLGQEVVSPAVESPLTPVETSPAPVEELISPVEYTPAQEEPIPSPVEPTPAPVEPTPAPVEPTPAPVEPTPAPVEPTPAPVEPTPAPVEPTPAPVEPTPAPVEPTPAPVEPTPAPVEPTPAPVEPTPAPVEPTPAPVESTPTPVEATLPSEPTSEKVETPAPAAAVPAKAAAKTVKEGAPTPKVRTPAKTTKAPVTKATPDKKPTPGRATPARPTPGKATPTRTPISKTPTPKATEKTASPKPLSRVAPTKPAADKPTAAKPGTARPASAKPTATRPATGTAGATRPTATRPLARKPAEKPAATTSTTTKAPATRPTTGAPRPGSARPIPAARTTTTSTVKKTAPTKTADKPDAGKLVNGSATRTTTARKPLTQTATKTSTTRPAAEKETKNTTNRILSTTRPASKPGTTATTRPTVSRTAAAARSSTTESKTTSRVDATTKARTSTTTKSAATRTAGVAVKKTLVTKTKTAGTKTAATKAEKSEATVLETSEPVVNGENKIADEETSVEVIEKCAVEDIMKASSEKVITESSQTMTTSEQVVVTTETTEVIVNGDH
ncbi:uncharacterized protein LOC125045780 isoform X2 [Penaeus chinensis]|uniref:uncharacterized protein LOC125045780 isoform X2 n=1 Tax=Penaeus chinensis TaxID=139456 RepID=UPI001FB69DAF|nr:uncharacterized protein LOC125045780 isoform X2 [Penaeus chinensis]